MLKKLSTFFKNNENGNCKDKSLTINWLWG